MPKLVVNGAKLKCSEGTAPSTLTVLPQNPADAIDLPVATVLDHKPMVNVAPFGMCKTQANPQVAAATAAAQGVLTPQPCVPVIPAPWSAGAARVTLQELKVLTEGSTCMCQWGGTVEITDPGNSVEVE
ncbi:DUF4280 domain-containing protein [Polyangium sp. 15x6]|uniref:DUF4280 domain-containing protein n=1 Tax=Polyangium sp. 15x6 TaxID=3042687 RepID=UPI00249A069A|nr:DUF4280 domain-containing protein [Polyangium sp. 15x6]MDI3291581.1 DUF4280 domain-containing protein [Polyangium sp. 15x6]